MACVPFDLHVTHPEGQRTLFCDSHPPAGGARSRGTVVIVHGFKGYKDYGMFPALAEACAGWGFTAIRFNLSHSGMTRDVETFARPDLFALDTWNRQVDDIRALVEAIRRDEVPNADPTAPVILIGHSRGGVASILTGGRDDSIDRVIALSAPGATRGMEQLGDVERTRLEENDCFEVASSRTGQILTVGRAFFAEVDQDPDAHDVEAHAARLGERLFVVHGADDETVPAEDALRLAKASGGAPTLIPGGNHVFNVANPFPSDAEPPPQLQAALDSIGAVLRGVSERQA